MELVEVIGIVKEEERRSNKEGEVRRLVYAFEEGLGMRFLYF